MSVRKIWTSLNHITYPLISIYHVHLNIEFVLDEQILSRVDASLNVWYYLLPLSENHVTYRSFTFITFTFCLNCNHFYWKFIVLLEFFDISCRQTSCWTRKSKFANVKKHFSGIKYVDVHKIVEPQINGGFITGKILNANDGVFHTGRLWIYWQ